MVQFWQAAEQGRIMYLPPSSSREMKPVLVIQHWVLTGVAESRGTHRALHPGMASDLKKIWQEK